MVNEKLTSTRADLNESPLLGAYEIYIMLAHNGAKDLRETRGQ